MSPAGSEVLDDTSPAAALPAPQIKFEPNVMVDSLSPTMTLSGAQLEDGDIIVFQRQLSQAREGGGKGCSQGCIAAGVEEAVHRQGAVVLSRAPSAPSRLTLCRRRRRQCSAPPPRTTWSLCATGRWSPSGRWRARCGCELVGGSVGDRAKAGGRRWAVAAIGMHSGHAAQA